LRRLLITAALLLFCAPGAAHAAVRSITVQDPNDAPPALSGPQDEDVRSATLSYDEAGSVTFTVSFFGSLNGSRHRDLSISADLAGKTSTYSSGCDILDPNHAWVFVLPKSNYASLTLDGFTGSLSGSVALSTDGATFTATFAHPALANRDFRCGSVGSLSYHYYSYSYCDFAGCPRSSAVVDTVGVGGWFAGYAPACDDGQDNDGDGKVDRADPTCNDSPHGTTEGAPNAAPQLRGLSMRILTVNGLRYLNGRGQLCDDRGGRLRLKLAQRPQPAGSASFRSHTWRITQPAGCRAIAFTWPLIWKKAKSIRFELAAQDEAGLATTATGTVRVRR
jgi:hypothetical protein